MRARLIEPDDPVWATVVGRVPHDFHHLPGYVALSADHEGGLARALLVEDGPRGMLLPTILRPIPGGTTDASSPYGYTGPLVWGTSDPDFVRATFQAGIELLRSEGIVSLFVRLHPLLDPVPPVGVGTLVTHGETVSIDLTQPSEQLWAQTRYNHRRDIHRALRLGHAARLDDRWEHFETFVRLYRETMERLSADERYMFDETYFRALRAALGPSLTLWVVMIDETVAAAVLFVETSGIVQYHLMGTDERYAKARPSKLLINTVREWAKDRGDLRLHLGGGVGAAYDSLMHFKAGFSDERHVFRTLRVVVDEDEYARLVAAHDPALDPTDLGAFFPLYRRPDPAARRGAGATSAKSAIGVCVEPVAESDGDPHVPADPRANDTTATGFVALPHGPLELDANRRPMDRVAGRQRGRPDPRPTTGPADRRR